MNIEFWNYLQELVDTSQIVIDRPKGSSHPRFPGQVYPVNYGYLEPTTSIDGGGVDIWVGSLEGRRVVGILCTVDMLKRDTELKIAMDCTDDEIRHITEFVNGNRMQAFYIKR
jgi:inorganic pyrophosphatase